MSRFELDHATDEEVARETALYEPFTQAVRDLADATIRTLVDEDEIRAAQAEVEAITERLRRKQIEGSYGVKFSAEGRGRPWGNAVMGLRNPIAPPLTIETDGTGKAWSDFHLGAAYEGPPGLAHGGVVALVLDQMLGQAAGSGGRPGMTGILTIRYRKGTPLGPLRAEAWIDRSDGIKTWAKGEVIGPDGVTAEAEGLFILPRWAREKIAARAAREADGLPAEVEGEEPEPSYFE